MLRQLFPNFDLLFFLLRKARLYKLFLNLFVSITLIKVCFVFDFHLLQLLLKLSLGLLSNHLMTLELVLLEIHYELFTGLGLNQPIFSLLHNSSMVRNLLTLLDRTLAHVFGKLFSFPLVVTER